MVLVPLMIVNDVTFIVVFMKREQFSIKLTVLKLNMKSTGVKSFSDVTFSTELFTGEIKVMLMSLGATGGGGSTKLSFVVNVKFEEANLQLFTKSHPSEFHIMVLLKVMFLVKNPVSEIPFKGMVPFETKVPDKLWKRVALESCILSITNTSNIIVLLPEVESSSGEIRATEGSSVSHE